MTTTFIVLAVLFRGLAYTMNRIEHGIIYSLDTYIRPEHPVLNWWYAKRFWKIRGIHKSGHIMHWSDHITLFCALMAGLHPLGWKAWIACAVWAFFSRWIASPAQYYINIGSGLPANPGKVRWIKSLVGLILCGLAFLLVT